MYWIGTFLSGLIVRFFGRFKIIGAENIPKTGGVLLCCNHLSHLDPPALSNGCPRHIHYIAKQELFDDPYIGWLFHRIEAIPVKRGTADRNALKLAAEFLDKGCVVGMFPEGTRSVDGKLQPPEAGVGLIALRSKAVVVPACVIGTDKVFPAGAKFFKFGRIKIVYGKPINMNDLYEKSGREAVDAIGERIMEHIQLLLDENKGVVK